jgi:hypothetical protein
MADDLGHERCLVVFENENTHAEKKTQEKPSFATHRNINTKG